MARLAYMRGDGMEMALDESLLPGMRTFAMSSGLRRLAPVAAPEERCAEAGRQVVLLCSRCGRTGLPHEMLANVDGEPFKSYEHEKLCTERTE